LPGCLAPRPRGPGLCARGRSDRSGWQTRGGPRRMDDNPLLDDPPTRKPVARATALVGAPT
jgi:hypothetical protein